MLSRMKLDGYRESDNIDDRRGVVTGGRVAIGGAGIVIVVVYSLVTHQNPIDVLNRVTQDAPVTTSSPRQFTPQEQQAKRFVSRVLASTEDAWSEQFNHMRRTYTPPRLALYDGETPTACGEGQSAVGPFYCPADREVYLDLEFFAELAQKFGSPGDFAQAYVVAHEVGHHVQNLLGEEGSGRGANGGSVRMELQADCYAGVWGAWAKRHGLLEAGDPAEAIRAATAIGDDTLQRRARGRVAPDSFTHGTSAQRVKWFTRGLQTGDPAQCDTFRARDL
jgi:predicted metalloprotease